MPKTYLLERVQLIERERTEVFAFFSDARNLEALTPAFLHFKISTPGSIEIKTGTLIDYRLRLFGVPLRWRTRIESFDPPHGFTDIQLAGPYRRWHHTHEFVAVPQCTLMTDRVEYEMPLGMLGGLAHVLFVRRTLGRVFDYRYRCVKKLMPAR